MHFSEEYTRITKQYISNEQGPFYSLQIDIDAHTDLHPTDYNTWTTLLNIHSSLFTELVAKINNYNRLKKKNNNKNLTTLEIRSMERGICPIATLALHLTLYSLTGS